MFRLAANFLGFADRLSPHSLRIGAATHAALTGMSDAMIRTAGRWSSSAYTRYVRLPNLQL